MDSKLLKEQLLLECTAMASYALECGESIPSNTLDLLESYSSDKQPEPKGSRNLILLHKSLSGIVSPAKPSSLLLLTNEKRKKHTLGFLGIIPLVRRMMIVALFFLVVFVVICISPFMHVENLEKGILDKEVLPVLFNLLFYITAAGLGSSFYALFTANRYIVQGVFNPKYETSYWVRFILGIIAGVILATLIGIEIPETSKQLSEHEREAQAFLRPILAMVGGFSASLFYKILNRFVEAIHSLIIGPPNKQSESPAKEQRDFIIGQSSDSQEDLNPEVTELQGQHNDTGDIEMAKERVSSIESKIIDKKDK